MGGLGELAAVGTVRPCQGGGGSPELEKMAAVRGMGAAGARHWSR
jgi:hypothetical protein